MEATTYERRRGELELYFDETAVDAWERLTSDAPVGRIRATVRAGREEMRDTLLSWLPGDLSGRRVLDAGCGTGALAECLARRGAEVVAVDLSPTLVGLASDRVRDTGGGSIEFRVGDMLDEAHGMFDHCVAMDSFIHYDLSDMTEMVGRLAARSRESVLFTFAPRTRPLAVMHAVGRLFPRASRAPSVEPIDEQRVRRGLAASTGVAGWTAPRTHRVARGFYISQAMEVRRR